MGGNKKTTGVEKMIIKIQTKFIETDGGVVYLPRPTGWLVGMARHSWFLSKYGKKAHIASPGLWDKLLEKNPAKELIEYDDGQIEVRHNDLEV